MNEQAAEARIYIMAVRASDRTSLHARTGDEDGEVMHALPSELCSWPPVNWSHMHVGGDNGRPYCTPVRLAAIRGSHFRVVPPPAGLLSCIAICVVVVTHTLRPTEQKEGSRDG